jgi:hypothetical protein
MMVIMTTATELYDKVICSYLGSGMVGIPVQQQPEWNPRR